MTSRVTRSLFERETRAIEENATPRITSSFDARDREIRFDSVLRNSTEKERERENRVLTFFSPVFSAFPL